MFPHAIMTADELRRISRPGGRTELVRGVVVSRDPAGARHAAVTALMATRINTFVMSHQLGRVLQSRHGFKLASDPDTVRIPDVAFIRADRLPPPSDDYPALAPDLVVEVLSSGDRTEDMARRIWDWLTAGSRLVWVVDPNRFIARAYRPDGSETPVSETQALGGEDVLPGFSFPLSRML